MVAPLPKNSKPRARVIAFYLPQFHPIPENDAWWGTGFTEWTPVVKAKPLFRGHRQPRIPTELGFYDLRVPEVREQQAALARDHGIEGFCYWHYWLGDGRRLLERPFDEVLVSGKPDFPFCLGWANHDWKGTIFGAGKRCLIEQRYPGRHDHEEHFRYLLRAFQDSRYIRVDDKPLLYIYRPQEIPNAEAVFDLWRDMALQAGLTGLHIVGAQYGKTDPRTYGLDSAHCVRHRKIAALRVRVEGTHRQLVLFSAKAERSFSRNNEFAFEKISLPTRHSPTCFSQAMPTMKFQKSLRTGILLHDMAEMRLYSPVPPRNFSAS
jgi:lipopolysaccharide biosynthesis protein